MIVKMPGLFDIHIDEIPQAGLELDCDLPEGWLAKHLGLAYRPSGKPESLVARIRREGDNVLVTATVLAEVECDCSRCAEGLSRPLDLSLKALFVPEDAAHIHLEDMDLSSDGLEGMFEYAGRTFSIEPLLAEAVVFALEDYPLCTEDCAGLCPTCGGNLNVEKCECGAPGKDSPFAALEKLKNRLARK